MSKQKLAPAKDFSARSIEDWNATTFSAYLSHLHEETYGLPYQYFNGGMLAEKRLIKLAYEDIGQADLKEVIDRSFATHKIDVRFPFLSFGFINTYLKPRIHAQILYERKQQEKHQQSVETSPSIEELEEWL